MEHDTWMAGSTKLSRSIPYAPWEPSMFAVSMVYDEFCLSSKRHVTSGRPWRHDAVLSTILPCLVFYAKHESCREFMIQYKSMLNPHRILEKNLR